MLTHNRLTPHVVASRLAIRQSILQYYHIYHVSPLYITWQSWLPSKYVYLKYIEIRNIVCLRSDDHTILVVYQFPTIMYFTHRFEPGKIVVVNDYNFADPLHVLKCYSVQSLYSGFTRQSNKQKMSKKSTITTTSVGVARKHRTKKLMIISEESISSFYENVSNQYIFTYFTEASMSKTQLGWVSKA